jgi:hypothetical protein
VEPEHKIVVFSCFPARLYFYVLAEKEGKAVHLSYEDKLKLVAYTCQVSHGKFNSDTVPALGVLDVIGRDRRYVHAIYVVTLIASCVKLSSVSKAEWKSSGICFVSVFYHDQTTEYIYFHFI